MYYGVVGTIAHNSALVALVPHPREHQWTYFGVLAPASPLRDAVVPRRTVPSPGPGIGEPEAEPEADPCAKAQRQSWAELRQRTFAVDVLRCPTCGGRRHRVATLTDPLVARRILHHSSSSSGPPRRAPTPRARPTRAPAALRLIRRPRATAARPDRRRRPPPEGAG